MIDKALDVLIIDAGLISAFLVVCIARNLIRNWQRHHPLSNRRLKRRYRAEHPQDSRTPGAPGEVRRRSADAGDRSWPRPPASAGPHWSQP